MGWWSASSSAYPGWLQSLLTAQAAAWSPVTVPPSYAAFTTSTSPSSSLWSPASSSSASPSWPNPSPTNTYENSWCKSSLQNQRRVSLGMFCLGSSCIDCVGAWGTVLKKELTWRKTTGWKMTTVWRWRVIVSWLIITQLGAAMRFIDLFILDTTSRPSLFMGDNDPAGQRIAETHKYLTALEMHTEKKITTPPPQKKYSKNTNKHSIYISYDRLGWKWGVKKIPDTAGEKKPKKIFLKYQEKKGLSNVVLS